MEGKTRTLPILAAILLAAVGAALLFPVSIRVGDELGYISGAQWLSRGIPPGRCYVDARLGVTLPMALFYAILGDAEPISRIFPLIAYIGNAGLAYILTRRAISAEAGLVAAGLACMYPCAYWQSTVPNSDAILGLWVNLSFWAFLAAREREDAGGALRGATIAGAFLGLAYMAKELGVLAIVPLGVLAIAGGRRKRHLVAGLAIGLVAAVGIEFLLSQILWGSPIERWTLVRANYKPNPHGPIDLAARAWSYPLLLVDPLRTESAWVGAHFALAIAGLVWAAIRRDRRIAAFAAWMGLVFLTIAYASSSISSWKPILGTTEGRYLAPIALPAHLFGAWFIVRLAGHGGVCRALAISMVVLVALHSGVLCAILRRDAAQPLSGLRQGVGWLSGRPRPAAVYSDRKTIQAMQAILGAEPGFPLRDFLTVDSFEGEKGLIFYNSTFARDEKLREILIDPASVGARPLARFEGRPPWRLRAWLERPPRKAEPAESFAIWEIPGESH